MTILKEMEQLVAALLRAYQAKDAAACAALYSEDGAVYSPYAPPAMGRAAIQKLHQDWLDEGDTNKRLEILEAGGDSDIAYVLLAYAGDTPQEDGGVITESGTSLNLCQRQPDGSWRIHISSLTSDTPPLV